MSLTVFIHYVCNVIIICMIMSTFEHLQYNDVKHITCYTQITPSNDGSVLYSQVHIYLDSVHNGLEMKQSRCVERGDHV